MTTVNKKINSICGVFLPQSFLTQDDAFNNGNGDIFFKFDDNSIICISKNDILCKLLIENGYKTMFMQFLENK
jgi:hypothetical protein